MIFIHAILMLSNPLHLSGGLFRLLTLNLRDENLSACKIAARLPRFNGIRMVFAILRPLQENKYRPKDREHKKEENESTLAVKVSLQKTRININAEDS